MTQAPEPEAIVVGFLTTAIPDVPCSTDLPDNFGGDGVDDPQSYIWVNALPGNVALVTWGGPVVCWDVALDIDCFGPTREDAVNLSRQCVDALPGLQNQSSEFGQVTRVRVSTFSPRPDWNEKIRRYGSTMSMYVRPATAG